MFLIDHSSCLCVLGAKIDFWHKYTIFLKFLLNILDIILYILHIDKYIKQME